MKKFISVIGLCLLFAASSVMAEVIKSFRAYVVSVDVAKKTMTFRVPNDATPTQWSELVAKWNEVTVWEHSAEKTYKSEPATVTLVVALRKDSKVYASVNDRDSSQKSWTLESLSTLPLDSTIP